MNKGANELMGKFLLLRSYKISIYLCLFLLLAASNSFAEDRGKKEYWISKYGEVKESTLSIRAQEVFNRVLSASDRRAGIEPALYIINYNGAPWAQSLADGSIILSKNGLEFCYKNQSFEIGDARIAFVIGHELAHQFNGDFWHYKFLHTAEDDKESMRTFQDIKELARKPEMLLAKEIQADQYGIIYATLAGYNSDEIISEDKNFFLEWAERENPYTHSGKDILLLSKKRSKAVSMRLKEVSDRIVLFQLGVISYHIGRYDDALSLFNRFASYFPGREVYSNIGAIYLRLAYEKFLSSRTPESFPFLLSFGIDVKTRAETIDISRGFTEGRYRGYKKLVRIAIKNLKKAIEHDPFYQEAKNSQGCAYILENKYYDAVSILEEVLKSAPYDRRVQNNLAVACILLGQEVASRQLTAKAEKLLMAAREEDYSAKSNWNSFQLMEGKSDDIPLSSNLFEESARDFTSIEFKPSFKLKTGMKVSHENYLSIVEDISDAGKGGIRVFNVPKQKIFLLTKNSNVLLILYKKPSGLKLNVKGGKKLDIYISNRNSNGVIFSKNKSPYYFEF